MNKKSARQLSLLLILIILILGVPIQAQNTFVPDDNFEQALIDLGFDSGPLNDYVPTQNIETVVSLEITDKGIMDLTGIEGFVSIEFLNMNNNNTDTVDLTSNSSLNHLSALNSGISSIDLTNNHLLEILSLDHNKLVNIDLSQNSELKFMTIIDNELEALDIENNKKLVSLSCFMNNITSFSLPENSAMEYLIISTNPMIYLDVSEGQQLYYLSAGENNLSQLDVTQNLNLEVLLLTRSEMEEIDVSQNPKLFALWVDETPISEVDVSLNPDLWEIRFGSTNIKELDLSLNPLMKRIIGPDNPQLCTVDVRNGNNTIITEFNLNNCPILNCVYVEDASYSEINWTNIDATASFAASEVDCRPYCCPLDLDFDLTDENIIVENNSIRIVMEHNELDFLYSLNSNLDYQEDPAFFNLGQGSYTVFVIDSNFCMEKSISIDLPSEESLSIPKYFTPNSDGYNDLWKVTDINNSIELIYIFNRFGKLLKTLQSSSLSWNGVYNGNRLRADDYWYSIILKNGKTLKGHFSLRI